MRLTTKIVLGIILGIFLLALGFIVGFSFTDRKNYSYRLDNGISQENKIEIDVAEFKTVWLDYEPQQHDYNIHLDGKIRIRPIQAAGENNKLSLSEELKSYTSIISSNDTLIIRINLTPIYEKYNFSKKEYIYSVVDNVDFELTTNAVDIINNLSGIKIDVKDIKTNNIKFDTSGDIRIDACEAKQLSPFMRSYYKTLEIENSKITNLNIDCDQIGNWTVKNCDIEVENLTGSNYSNAQLPKSEAKVMNWFPKNKDAKLEITLYGDTARIVFP